ncbi:acyl-CoA carboxylase subunit beta [Brooklawnia cerclae]|uniref:Acetyl-CoA/propionyl-CoA carboxylase carboxyl transferase subunit n=1 Tax=Brooklawnia cerclae TaxID=349934 RepID=A0ABX0SFX9_9ACTN|nr:acyl-CoA carboxylase subunit beta [Brooklawnia cerclae]NIH56819.1 acetyl-CoA/propionyl-CoA carboxylase carboxyl transferase subunit [Brooklawnia cerclae]
MTDTVTPEQSSNDHLTTLRAMREKAIQGGGTKRIEAQHAKGKMTARERLSILLDEGSFQELGALATHQLTDFGMDDKRFPGDGVITGFGKINGRRVAVYAQDFTVLGGSFSQVQAQKINKIQDLALESGIPIVGLNDSGGARVQEGVRSLAAYGEVFQRNVASSGVIPQISLIMGPCAGGAVYSPALTDFTVMVDTTSNMFLTGPEIVASVTGEQVTAEELGGAAVHAGRSGVAQFEARSEVEALELTKLLLSYLPSNTSEDAPTLVTDDSPDRMDDNLNELVPDDDRKAYDMRDVLDAVFDADSILEVHQSFAPNAIVAFARLDGRPVGIVANQPMVMSGVLDIDSSDKISRFIRICDVYSIPIITFVDCPGYLPGVEQEYNGVIRHGAKIIYAYCQSTVPKISVVTRKAIGGSYVALSSKQMGADVAFAWPTAQIAVMGPEGAARLLHGKAIKASEDPAATEAEFIAEYRERFFNPYRAADLGQIDEVIEPRETRPRLVRALEVLQTKVSTAVPKKHGLFPV